MCSLEGAPQASILVHHIRCRSLASTLFYRICVHPPSTISSAPVVNEASEARNSTGHVAESAAGSREAGGSSNRMPRRILASEMLRALSGTRWDFTLGAKVRELAHELS
jgi:hypothetical protein